MIRAAFRYWGGKYYHLKHILPNLPNKKLFVDVFGGSGVVVQNKNVEGRVYNDIHSGLNLFFNVLKHKESFYELVRLLELTLYAREEFHLALDYETIPDPVTSAAAFFVKIQQSFAGAGEQWSRDKKERPRGASGFQKAKTELVRLHKIWEKITVDNLSWQECIKKYDSLDTVFYLDPPYTCPSGEVYDYTFSKEDHQQLASYINRHTKGFVALSGYANSVYDRFRWDRRLTWSSIENTNQTKVEEVLWIKE